jgi:CDP-paratose 2-epimerase
MKLLITGGCGFLGSNLSADAIARGDELVIFDNLYSCGSRENLVWLQTQGSFRFEYGDIRNLNDLTQVFQTFRPDAIFHLAGQVAMTSSIINPRLDFEVNAIGTLNLLEVVRLYSPDATIIYSSTNKIYGDLEQYQYSESNSRFICDDYPNGFDEKIPLNFHSPYGCSKGTADQYMLDYARIFKLKTVVFRHSSMYGGRQFANSEQGWVGWFCQKAIETSRGNKEAFTISGSGKQVRDLLHADDIKRLYLAAVNDIELVRGNSFNIGGGIVNSLSLLELFSLLEQMLGIQLSFNCLPVRVSDQRVFVADTSKVSEMLPWQPQVTTKAGLESMLSWVSLKI